MQNKLIEKITFIKIMKFTIPAIISLLFMSLYTIIDGIFVANLIGSSALASVNIVLPLISVIMGIAIMISTGSSALIGIYLGKKEINNAKEKFSYICFISLTIGIIISILGFIFIDKILILLGTPPQLYSYCYDYSITVILSTPFIILRIVFGSFMYTEGKHKLGFIITLAGGILNIFLDYIFIAKLNMGVFGAGLATALGMLLPCLLCFIYFCSKKSILKFSKFKFDFKFLKSSLLNGSSEMLTQISDAITTFLFNIIALKLIGENGVSAITIILYVDFAMSSVAIGFSTGLAPLISNNYGAKLYDNIKKISRYSFIFIIISSIIIFIFSIINAEYVIAIFSKNNIEVYNLSIYGFKLFCYEVLFVGINILTSSIFTAFGNGKISAILSFLRFGLVITGILTLPFIFPNSGIWIVLPITEGISTILSIILILKYKNKYHL